MLEGGWAVFPGVGFFGLGSIEVFRHGCPGIAVTGGEGGFGGALLEGAEVFELAAPVEFFDEAAGAAPLFFDLNEELEEDAGAEERLHIFAGGGADALEHFAAFADKDGFLAGALADDGRGDFCDGEPGVGGALAAGFRWIFPFFDDDGRGVGDLFAGEHEDFFADELGDEEALGLVGDLILGEVALALGEVGDDAVEQEVEVVLFAGGDGDDFRKGVEGGPVGDDREQVDLGNGVGLVEDEEDGAVELLDERQGEVVFGLALGALGGGERFAGDVLGRDFRAGCGEAVGGVDDEEDGVAALEGVEDFLHHAAVELGFRAVDAGCVDEDDLRG